jgi:hypothetical protein
MVLVEIHSPVYDEEAGSTRLLWRTTVRASGDDFEIQGDSDIVEGGALPVVDVLTGKQLQIDDDPERWARNLPYAFRAGDLLVSIVADSSAPADDAPEPEIPRDPPSIPAPPAADLSSSVTAGRC